MQITLCLKIRFWWKDFSTTGGEQEDRLVNVKTDIKFDTLLSSCGGTWCVYTLRVVVRCEVTLVVQAFEIWVQDDLRLNRQISATVSKANKRFITSGDTKNSPTGELIQEGHDHASSIMSLFESRNHHVIFRKNNLDF